jgi:hypothetical protein
MTNSTDKKLDVLINSVQKLIDNPVKEIAPIAPVAPVLPIIPMNSGDHDLLTKLDTKVDQIQMDVTELKNKIPLYVTQSEYQEILRVQRIHEDEIKKLESFRDTLTGKIWGIGIIAGFGSGILMLIIQHYFNLAK